MTVQPGFLMQRLNFVFCTGHNYALIAIGLLGLKRIGPHYSEYDALLVVHHTPDPIFYVNFFCFFHFCS